VAVVRRRRTGRDGARPGLGPGSLVGILTALIVVGLLAAFVIRDLDDVMGEGERAACRASKDAAGLAATVHYASHGSYAATFPELSELETGQGFSVSPDGRTLRHGSHWRLDMSGGGTTPNTFEGCP
jgi:hypothetical protein